MGDDWKKSDEADELVRLLQDSVEVLATIGPAKVVRNATDLELYTSKGAKLIGVVRAEWDHETPFRMLVGWPKDAGPPPSYW